MSLDNPLIQLVDPFHGYEDVTFYPTAKDPASGRLIVLDNSDTFLNKVGSSSESQADALMQNAIRPFRLSDYAVVESTRVSAGWRHTEQMGQNSITIELSQGFKPVRLSFGLKFCTDVLDSMGGIVTGGGIGYDLDTYFRKYQRFYEEMYTRRQISLEEQEAITEELLYGLDERSVIPSVTRQEIWALDIATSNPVIAATVKPHTYGETYAYFRFVGDCEVDDTQATDSMTAQVTMNQFIPLTISGLFG